MSTHVHSPQVFIKMDFVDIKEDSLKCVVCDGTLSTFPVYTREDGKYVCGHCKVIGADKARRNFAYEALAQHFHFPCAFASKGCTSELTPAMLPSHEKTCVYMPVSCLPPCTWWDTVDKLHQHCTATHKGLMIENAKAFVAVEERYFLYAHNEVFLIEIEKTEEKFNVSIKPVNPTKSNDLYEYDVNFTSSWSEQAQTMNNCPRRDYVNFGVRFDDIRVHGATVTCLIIVVDKTGERRSPPDLLSNVMNRIRCKMCKTGVTAPPVYECCTYVPCEDCLKTNPICPSCHTEFSERRNRALDEITEECVYVCKHLDCTQMLTGDKKWSHERQCAFRPYLCPFCNGISCKIENLLSHARLKHTANSLGLIKLGTKAKIWNRSLFFVMTSRYVNKYNFNVWRVGPYSTENSVWSVLKVCVKDRPLDRIYIKQKCEEYPKDRIVATVLKYLANRELIMKVEFEQVDNQ